MADTSAKVIITAQDATTAGLRSVERNLRGMQKEAQSLSGSLKSMAGALGISLGVSTAISGIQRFVSSTIELADSMGKTAEQTGMTVEQISALRFVAEQADVEFSTLQSSLIKFNRTIAEAGTGRAAQLSIGKGIEIITMNAESWYVARIPFQTTFVAGVSMDALPADTFSLGRGVRSSSRTTPRSTTSGISSGFHKGRPLSACHARRACRTLTRPGWRPTSRASSSPPKLPATPATSDSIGTA